jgi:heterodisulfide reductase subunit B
MGNEFQYSIPVVFYGQLMAVAVGMDANKNATLDHNMLEPVQLVELAKKSGT